MATSQRNIHFFADMIGKYDDTKETYKNMNKKKMNSNRILFLPNSFEHEQENPFEQFYKILLLIILFCLVDKMQYNVSDILLKSMLFSYPKWVSTGDD